MILTTSIADHIVKVARTYIGRPFDYEKFNCVHFVREVYAAVGIELPLLMRELLPPREFHLSREELSGMPIGHSVFLKRKTSRSGRSWTHVAIIVSFVEVIHCSRRFGGAVTVTAVPQLFEVYELAPMPL
jgi:hypothetical protein